MFVPARAIWLLLVIGTPQQGMLREPLLPFLWRATALKVEDYPYAIRMLCEASVLFELPPPAPSLLDKVRRGSFL